MAPVPGVKDGIWHGIASFSQSVLCVDEPYNTKPIFQRVVLRALELLTSRMESIPFVQVGANDGVRADHIRPLVLSGKWRGILIEPAPIPYERLLANYKGINGLKFMQVAVSTTEGRMPFYYVDGDDGLSSFALDTILNHAPKYHDLEGMIRQLEVEARTLDSICDQHGIDPAVVAVDTEGTDDIVLKSFSLEKRKPKVVLFEHCHLSAERSAALKLLHDRHDALAIAHGTFEGGVVEFFEDIMSAARSNSAPRPGFDTL
jgi:FkbM family methyltransferase